MDRKSFIVNVQEVHISRQKVQAFDEEDAIQGVMEGCGEEIGCEYSHTLDQDTWSVDLEEKV